MTLFPEVSNYSSEVKPNDERTYDFFTRVCDWPDMESARERMELWFSHLPYRERVLMRQTMSQGSDEQFDACFFELFLHEFVLASGCSPEIHPPLARRRRTPDFSVHSAGGLGFLMEAVVVTDKPNRQRREEKIQGQILDMLNSLPSPRMSFAIRELAVKSSQPPSLRNVREFVMKQITAASDDSATLPDGIWEYEDDRVKIQISPIPHSAKSWKTNVGSGPAKFRWGGPEAAIAAKLHKKATRYGRLEKPFVVAVNVVSEWTNSLECVTRALLGVPEETLHRAGSDSEIRQYLGAESFWHKSGTPQHRTVSAVLATRMFPWSVLRAPLRLYHNPHARYPLPENVFRVEQVTRALALTAGSNLQNILG